MCKFICIYQKKVVPLQPIWERVQSTEYRNNRAERLRIQKKSKEIYGKFSEINASE